MVSNSLIVFIHASEHLHVLHSVPGLHVHPDAPFPLTFVYPLTLQVPLCTSEDSKLRHKEVVCNSRVHQEDPKILLKSRLLGVVLKVSNLISVASSLKVCIVITQVKLTLTELLLY